MSDLDYLHAQRVRQALQLRDGRNNVDWDEFDMALLDHHRGVHGLAAQGRLEILL